MSKTTAPLLSFDARGQIGKSQVYSSWKGRSYARRYVIPANPNSSGQQDTRNTFKFLNNVWRSMPSTAIEAWDAYAKNARFIARNGFIKVNLAVLKGDANLADFIISPAANGGIKIATATVTPGAGQLTIAPTEPALPTGWTIVNATAAAIRSQDPQTGTLYTVSAVVDSASPWSIVITGLTASQLYRVGVWFKFQKSVGNYAYGEALMQDGTPS